MIPIRDRLPRRRAPIVNWLLILANVVAFIWERGTIMLGIPVHRFLLEWGLVPARIVAHPVESVSTVLSSMFLHDPTSWLHIGGNMLFLWIFGDNVEDELGHARYLGFYLLSGLAAATAQVLIDPSSPVPMVGASGAIAGVLAAYGTLYPRSPITVVNPILPAWLFFGVFIELPAWIVILEFFVMNLLNGVASLGVGSSTGVAFFAHLGGFVAGLALVRWLRPEPRGRPYAPWQGFRAPPRQPPPARYDGYYYPPPPSHRPWGR